MEFFSNFQGSDQKTSFTKCFSKGFKIDFQNKKLNYLKRKGNHFSHFEVSDQKSFFFEMFLICSKGFKIDFQNKKLN